MADIKTVFVDMTTGADFALDALGLIEDDGLQTAMIISLFTDRRANDDDVLPGDASDKRGWWADAFPIVPDDKIGSRLWLLNREKQLQSVLNRTQEYAREALQWMLDDGIAGSVLCTAQIVRQGLLGLSIAITPPAANTPNHYRFDILWSNT
jgi:phage gp46-like protein